MRRKDWPRKSGLGLGLGVGGGGIGYYLNDSFTTDVAAGGFAGAALNAVPGPGTRTVVDGAGAGTAAINSGSFILNNFSGTNDPSITYGAVTRDAANVGRILVGKTNYTSVNTDYFGYTSTVPASTNLFSTFRNGGVLYARTRTSPSTQAEIAPASSTGTNYYNAIILKNPGAFYIRKTATGEWYLMFIDYTDVLGTLYPLIGTASAQVNATDFIRIPTLLWTPKPISADDFGGTHPTLDNAVSTLTGLEAYTGATRIWENGNAPAASTWANTLGYAVNTPVAGSNVITNGDFTAWTGDNPNNWSVGAEDANNYVTENPAGKAQFVWNNSIYIGQVCLTVGNWYRAQVTIDSIDVPGSTFKISDTSTQWSGNLSTAATHVCTKRAAGVSSYLYRASASGGVTVDNFIVKPLPLNQLLQLTAHTGTPDVYAEVELSVVANGFQAGIALNWDSPTNPQNGDLIYLNMNDGKIYWDRCVGGTWTNYSSGGTGLTGGAKKLAVRKIGTSVYIWYDNAFINTYTSAVNPGATDPAYHGTFATGSSATETKLDLWRCYDVGSNGLYSLLDMFIN